MASIVSHRSPLSGAIPLSINAEDVDRTVEPSSRPSRPPIYAAENRFGRG